MENNDFKPHGLATDEMTRVRMGQLEGYDPEIVDEVEFDPPKIVTDEQGRILGIGVTKWRFGDEAEEG